MLRLEALFSPVLWKSCNQIPLAFRVKLPGGPQSLCRFQIGKPDMRLRSFTTMPELLWYYCSPDSESPTHLIYRDCTSPPILSWLLLCLRTGGTYFWGVPASSRQWWFRFLAFKRRTEPGSHWKQEPGAKAPLHGVPLMQRAP